MYSNISGYRNWLKCKVDENNGHQKVSINFDNEYF